jgi:hypothetical protein
MKKLGWLLFPVLAIALLLGGAALAQTIGDNSVYFVTYYSNANTSGAPDQTVRVINDGDTGASLWASFYVLDDNEEMQECCSCEVTPDGLTSESVNSNLTANSLTRYVNQRGAIKVISSSVAAGGPANFTNTPAAGLRVWSTHIQRKTPGAGGFHISETLAADSNLASSEKMMVETLCFYINLLAGGNQGVCSCTPKDQDF